MNSPSGKSLGKGHAEAVLKPGASLGEGRGGGGGGAEAGGVKANRGVGGKQLVSALLGASARRAAHAGC